MTLVVIQTEWASFLDQFEVWFERNLCFVLGSSSLVREHEMFVGLEALESQVGYNTQKEHHAVG